MIVGPASAEITSVDSNGYAVVDSVENLYVNIEFWLSKTGQTSLYCAVTSVDRATKTIGIRQVNAAVPRVDLTNYDSATIDIPEQLWTNPDGPTYGDIVVQNDLVVNNELVAYGPIFPAQYATADLPDATANTGAVVYDTTADELLYSDGSAWVAGGGGSGVTTMAAIGAVPNANGASISGTTLTLQPANASNGGVVANATQALPGKKLFADGLSSPTVAQSTTATCYLSVTSAGSNAYNVARDPISGGDYTATPYLTLQAAIDACPKVLKHSVFISIGAGSFAGAQISGFTGGGLDSADNPIGIYVTGHTANVTPTTGVATGTAGAGTTTTSMVKPTAAADWTASDLVGKLLVVTGGGGYVSANFPVVRPIKANTTTTLTVDAISGMDNTTTFNICTPDTIVQEGAGANAFTLAYNSAPVALRLCKTQSSAGTLDYGVYSSNNGMVQLDGMYLDEACTFNAIYSTKDSDVLLKNTAFLSGTDFIANYTATFVEVANVWLFESGPVALMNVLNGKVTKLDSDSAPSYVLQAVNMNSLQAEVDANNGDATPVYLETIGAFEAIGSNKLTGSGNTGTGCYGVEIQKAGRYTLIGSDIVGDDGDVLFMDSAVTWANLTSPSFGIAETYSGNAVGTGSYTKSIVYGAKLFNDSCDHASRELFYGHINQSANLVVPTFVASETYDMNANGVRGVLECICNSASATVVLPDACAIAGVVVSVVNRGSQTLTIEAPGVGTVTGAPSDTIAAGKSKTYVSLNGNSGQDFWLLSST